MDEKKKLFVYIALGYVSALIFFFLLGRNYDLRLLFSDLYIENYRADLFIDKNLRLSEEISFKVDTYGRYRMLFRYWDAPLTYNENLDIPFIKLKDINSDFKYYMKDYKGNVFFVDDDLRFYVEEKAFKNEVGLINLNFFDKGVYLLNVSYNLYPPIQMDNEYSHLNFKFSNEKHIPYKNLEVYIHDKNNLIVDIFPHIPKYNVEKTDDGYLIRGEAIAGLVEVEILMKRFPFNTFVKETSDIEKLTMEANRNYTIYKLVADTITNILYLLVFGFPIWAYMLYKRYGEEKFFVVPEFLSYIPNKNRTPYEVNLLFNGDAVKIDMNAFLSTLLDLHKKKKIKLKGEGDDLIIEILDENVNTPYEKLVIDFLKNTGFKVGDKHVFSLKMLNETINAMKSSKDISGLRSLKLHFDMVLNYVDRLLVKETLEEKGKLIVNSIFILSVLFSILALAIGFFVGDRLVIYHYDFYPAIILMVALTIENLFLFITPTQLFGRWKDNYYKEYLEWQAFRNMLKDMAMIKKYKPADISIWKDWLIYGTALGVAKNVEKAMKELNIKLPDISEETLTTIHHLPASYMYINKAIASVETAQRRNIGSGFGGGGGGFGVGGGFGGGGMGGR